MIRVATVLLFAAMLATPAQAQPVPCMERAKLAQLLARDYGEAVITRGITGSGCLVEMWGSVEKGTWSYVVTTPRGVACVMAAGSFLEVYAPAEPEEAL